MRRALWIALAVVVLANVAMAQGAVKRAMTAEEMVSMARLSSVAISPDGTKVLYVAGGLTYPPPRPGAEKPVSHIWMVPAGGGAPRQMTASDAGEGQPVWAPDGKSIAFVSRRSGSPQVFVMPADGGEGIQLGQLKVPPSSLKWLPDGKSLSFLAVPEKTAQQKAESEKTGDVEIFEAPKDLQQLFTLSYPEGTLKQITAGEYFVNDYDWSPDGKSIVIATAPSQLLYDTMGQVTMRVVDPAGKSLAVLSKKPGPAQKPSFSPDGQRVAWMFANGGLSLMNGVAVCSPDGKELKNAAEKVDLTFSQAEWAPDGKSLICLVQEGTRSVIRRLRLDGGKAEAIFAPAGAISGFSTDRKAARIAFGFADPTSPPNPWTVRADGTGAVRLADLNPQVAGWLLPKVERIRFTSSGGASIEALFARTPVPPAQGLPPLMVLPHGGPDWMDQEGFDRWVVYFGGNGYNVLRVNFRGSLAYGFDFYAANRGKLGFVDYDDIMAGVDDLVAKKEADPEKLVLGGWSYGGFMAEWAITRTDRFKASVVAAGVANHYSDYAQSDINHGVAGEWEFLGNPYENPENFDASSAVRHIASVRTPVLIIHGKEDSRVPFPQALELYRALKTTGKSVEMAAYPGEEHGFRKPEHTVDCFKRWLAFYDKALGIQRERDREPGGDERGSAGARERGKD